jgi:hypothetical protein
MLFTQGSPKLRQAQICPSFSASARPPDSRCRGPKVTFGNGMCSSLGPTTAYPTLGARPRWSGPFGERYAPSVQKSSLDERLVRLSDALRALTESERLLLRRLQEMRSAQYGRISPVEAARTPARYPALASRAPSPHVVHAPMPVELPPNVAFPSNRNAGPRVFETSPTPGAHWPTASGNEDAESAVGKRDYDFFAELDEKLSDLQKRGVGSRGS